MKPDRQGTVGIVGAGSLEGRELSERLKGHGLEGEQVLTFGPTLGPWEIQLEESEGEVLLPLERELVERAEVLFLISSDEKARETVAGWARELDILLVDMSPPAETRADWPDPFLETGLRLGRWGHVTLPEPEALYLARLLKALPRAGVERADCHLFRPASTLGEAGLHELYRQSADLLNFKPFPTEVFGRQVAFDLVAQPGLSGAGSFSDQARSLAGRDVEVTLAVVGAPVYHCAVLSVLVRAAGADRILKELAGRVGDDEMFKVVGQDAAWPSPSDAGKEEKPLLALKALSSDVLWLWMVYDNVKAGKAFQAARLYETLRRHAS
jgi:aspartate-semialdehyde dehydrogenase